MNPVYEQMQQKEEREVTDAVHKFAEAVLAFRKLNPDQKKRFFQNVVLQKCLPDVINDTQYEMPGIYRYSDSQK